MNGAVASYLFSAVTSYCLVTLLHLGLLTIQATSLFSETADQRRYSGFPVNYPKGYLVTFLTF